MAAGQRYKIGTIIHDPINTWVAPDLGIIYDINFDDFYVRWPYLTMKITHLMNHTHFEIYSTIFEEP